jgi:hypothetical protein
MHMHCFAFQDYFAYGHELPLLDPVQNFELLEASENQTHTHYVVRRNVTDIESYPPDFAIPVRAESVNSTSLMYRCMHNTDLFSL